MALIVVSIPIGNPQDISARALETLRNCNCIIGEERKEASKLLRSHGMSGKKLELLNEHSTDSDVQALVDICAHETVALISDCGTPVFCDPGARLIALCRQRKVPVTANPGASSLMTLLAVASQSLQEFVFRGFLPAENESRLKALRELQKEKRAFVLMDTPYRLKKLVAEMKQFFPERKFLLGVNMTYENEQFLEGKMDEIEKGLTENKAEFVLLAYSIK
ncbi:MAG: SAM-dependent methyltransferase [Pseudobdellovibrionaceae bacterium]